MVFFVLFSYQIQLLFTFALVIVHFGHSDIDLQCQIDYFNQLYQKKPILVYQHHLRRIVFVMEKSKLWFHFHFDQDNEEVM